MEKSNTDSEEASSALSKEKQIKELPKKEKKKLFNESISYLALYKYLGRTIGVPFPPLDSNLS